MVPDTAVAQWSHAWLEKTGDDPGAVLVEQLTALVAEDAYMPIEVHRTNEGLHIELYGDYHARGLHSCLDLLARSGATGRVWFPEDGTWCYTLTSSGADEQNGAEVYPGDEMMVLHLHVPDHGVHRAIYAEGEHARRAIDRHLTVWTGIDHRSPDLGAALAAVLSAGGVASCEAFTFAS